MAVVKFNYEYAHDPNDDRTFFHSSYRANGQLSGEFRKHGLFHVRGDRAHFPLWYPALVFALAGIGALCLGRRFTLRSAIVATAVVAGLLGVVVAL